MNNKINDPEFKITVVIPVYNSDKYLEETILSVVNQTIGFVENVEMILINDGSVDESKKICNKYKELYPNNIKYFEQENAGVSVARNNGLKYATGKYINFLDSDDKFDLDVLEKVYNFFEKNYDIIDVASCRVYQFEAVDRFHVLDFRFDLGDRVVDILDKKCYRDILLHVSSTFFKREAINDLRFDKDVKYGEDSLFVNQMILKKAKYGLVASAIHYYRKRLTGASAVQVQRFDPNFYTVSPKKHYSKLIELSIEKYGEVIPYVQNVLAYDIGWRVKSEIPAENKFTEHFVNEYFDFLKSILHYVNLEVIFSSKVHTSLYIKDKLVSVKTGKSLFDNITADVEKNSLYFDGARIISFGKNMSTVIVNLIDIDKDVLTVEGLLASWIFNVSSFEKVKFIIKINDIEIPVSLKNFNIIKESIINDLYNKFYSFSFSINLNEFFVQRKISRIRPYLDIDGDLFQLKLNYKKFVPNNIVFKPCYKFFGKYYTTCSTKQIRVVKPKNAEEEHKKLEKECLMWLEENNLNKVKELRLNLQKHENKKDKNKRIWLVSDRFEKAGDNGEAFFKYLSTRKKELKKNKVLPIFVISKNSPDRKRIKKYGKVVCFEDKNYPIYFLRAEKIISSSGGEFTINPFSPSDRKYFVDLMKYKYVFLQHGVIFNDLSKWLYKYNKNISKFVVSSKYEKNSIVNGEYGYSDENVVLTGLPRFDYLENKSVKLISILPSWRRSIRQSYDEQTNSVYFDRFKETEFFKFYNSLINDERVLAIMRKKGYKGLFSLHPIHSKQYVDFTENDVFEIQSGEPEYKDIISKSSLLVTDYSSVFADFAYLGKPVLYTMFDKKEFYKYSIFDEGYFDFEKDGFGPVCYDYESTVKKLIEFIENDCVINEKYLEKIEHFFEYNDKNNCKRVFEEIINK